MPEEETEEIVNEESYEGEEAKMRFLEGMRKVLAAKPITFEDRILEKKSEKPS